MNRATFFTLGFIGILLVLAPAIAQFDPEPSDPTQGLLHPGTTVELQEFGDHYDLIVRGFGRYTVESYEYPFVTLNNPTTQETKLIPLTSIRSITIRHQHP